MAIFFWQARAGNAIAGKRHPIAYFPALTYATDLSLATITPPGTQLGDAL